jgi:Xaa-Pro dipeptidase
MSGANSARASAAYAVTSNREIRAGDLVLIHANPFVDGYFADVTRTYVVGMPVGEIRAMYDAVFAAREAALGSIRPGVAASTVDRAAREIIERAGFGEFFTHGLGHSVGFSAISADFPPRLHPASTDVLEVGCTFNLEPAIYIEGVGGVRHCDVVTVNKAGPELLTPFHGALTDLVITSC